MVRDLSPDSILPKGRFCNLDAGSTVTRAAAIKNGRIVAVRTGARVAALTGPSPGNGTWTATPPSPLLEPPPPLS